MTLTNIIQYTTKLYNIPNFTTSNIPNTKFYFDKKLMLSLELMWSIIEPRLHVDKRLTYINAKGEEKENAWDLEQEGPS